MRAFLGFSVLHPALPGGHHSAGPPCSTHRRLMGTQRISEPADNKQASGYRSPPGTFEPVLKSILEDPALSDAEFRVALYLATKPEGWAAKPRQIARALNRPLSRIERALTGLRAKGLVTTAEERQNGVFTARTSRLNRALIVAPASKPPGQDQHAESAPWSPPADSPQTPRSEPARGLNPPGG
jgi:hypothetical protein